MCAYLCIIHTLSTYILCFTVYRVLDELKYNQYHSQMDRFLQLFHHRPVAAALYKKVICDVFYIRTCSLKPYNIKGKTVTTNAVDSTI